MSDFSWQHRFRWERFPFRCGARIVGVVRSSHGESLEQALIGRDAVLFELLLSP